MSLHEPSLINLADFKTKKQLIDDIKPKSRKQKLKEKHKKNILASYKQGFTNITKGLNTRFSSLSRAKKIIAILSSTLLLTAFIFVPIILIKFNKNNKIEIFKSAVLNYQELNSSELQRNEFTSRINDIVELPESNAISGIVRDEDTLVKLNENFSKAKQGDIVIIFPTKTFIYDKNNNTLTDIISANILGQKTEAE